MKFDSIAVSAEIRKLHNRRFIPSENRERRMTEEHPRCEVRAHFSILLVYIRLIVDRRRYTHD